MEKSGDSELRPVSSWRLQKQGKAFVLLGDFEGTLSLSGKFSCSDVVPEYRVSVCLLSELNRHCVNCSVFLSESWGANVGL